MKRRIKCTKGGKYLQSADDSTLYEQTKKAYNKIFIKKLLISLFCLYLGIMNAYYIFILEQYTTTSLLLCLAGLFFGCKELYLCVVQKYRIAKKDCSFSSGVISERISGTGFHRYFPSIIVNGERCVPMSRNAKKSEAGDFVRVITIPLYDNKIVRYALK